MCRLNSNGVHFEFECLIESAPADHHRDPVRGHPDAPGHQGDGAPAEPPVNFPEMSRKRGGMLPNLAGRVGIASRLDIVSFPRLQPVSRGLRIVVLSLIFVKRDATSVLC